MDWLLWATGTVAALTFLVSRKPRVWVPAWFVMMACYLVLTWPRH